MGKLSTSTSPYRLQPLLKLCKLSQNLGCVCMDFRFPYHEKSGAGEPDKASLPHSQQGYDA